MYVTGVVLILGYSVLIVSVDIVNRFHVFRKMLDVEMKFLYACAGEDYVRKAAKAERQAITEEEEKEMWRAGVLGESSVNTLLNTLYFYIGKLFRLRAIEHRMLRVHNSGSKRKCSVICGKC